MRKLIRVLEFFLCSSMLLLDSCAPDSDELENNELKSYWKLKSYEVWGIKPVSGAKYEQLSSFPFNQTFGFSSHANVTYTGQENNITKTEVDPISNLSTTLTNSWTKLPDKIYANTSFKITYESKGSAINGISISVPAYYNENFEWYTFSYNNGPITSTLLANKPDSDPNHQKLKIALHLASGYAYFMEWFYIYEWIP